MLLSRNQERWRLLSVSVLKECQYINKRSVDILLITYKILLMILMILANNKSNSKWLILKTKVLWIFFFTGRRVKNLKKSILKMCIWNVYFEGGNFKNIFWIICPMEQFSKHLGWAFSGLLTDWGGPKSTSPPS